MVNRAKILRAIAANHRSWFQRRGAAVQKCGAIDLIAPGSEGTIAFPAKRTRAAVTTALGRVAELKLRAVSCWSLTENKALGTLLIVRGFEWGGSRGGWRSTSARYRMKSRATACGHVAAAPSTYSRCGTSTASSAGERQPVAWDRRDLRHGG